MLRRSKRTPSPSIYTYRATSPHRFEMASSSGVKLAQEIHDEFLVCKICLEAYKNPKSLTCLHTFCENCIDHHVMSESTYKKYSDYREFTCPLCRKRTQLPIGGVKKLPDNFLVSSLSEVVVRQRPSKYPFCDICKMVTRKHREASSKCLDCAKLLCKQCVELHRETKVTSNHSIFDVEIEKDIECKEHQDEVVRFYCEPCETCICVLCTFNEHKDHEISQFGEAVNKYKENIEGLLSKCQDKIDKFDSQIEILNNCEETIKEAEQKIHDTAIKFIADIRTREKQLIEELQNIYGKETMEYINGKRDLATQVDGLRSTCNLTEVILKGKDIELLLLKKEVEQKLSSLNDVHVKNLPATINKQANFVPGSIDMGYMEDPERPLLSKLRATRNIGSQDLGLNIWPEFNDMGTQTEPKSEEEDSEESDEEESEEESESDSEKPTFEEIGVQTEAPEETETETESEEEEPKPEMKNQSTFTDEIETEEKGVNTRSRSLQGQNSIRRSPSKDESSYDYDNSLAARRRRRRERAQTSSVDGYSSQSFDGDSQYTPSYTSYNDYSTQSYYDVSKRRGRYSYHNNVEVEEPFFDAESNGGV